MSCGVRRKGMCGALGSDELLALSAHTRLVNHESGDELAGERMPTESYATVIRGVVKLTKTLEDGRQQIVGLQFAPDLLGRLNANENAVSVEAGVRRQSLSHSEGRAGAHGQEQPRARRTPDVADAARARRSP